jgi:hypothetical protein
MGRTRRTHFISGSDYHQSNRAGIAGPACKNALLAEVLLLTGEPANRFERRSRAKRLKELGRIGRTNSSTK